MIRSGCFSRGAILFVAALAGPGSAGSAPNELLWEKFSGDNAFAHVQRLVELGPRPAGSDALEKSRAYITQQLEASGWMVTRQSFTASTPRGPITFVNLIATRTRTPATGQFLLCSHYDTKMFDTFRFVGANDGGSSTGLLIELARVLAAEPKVAQNVQLVFFDGEEAFEDFTDSDGLYGSRHFAKERSDPKVYRGGILFDMIGDKSLSITLPPDSPVDLARDIFAAADALKVRNHFSYFDRPVTDDHTPLNAIGIPVIDLIDFDFPPWHTAEDTLDKISADSLRIVGQVALYYLAERTMK